MTWQAAERDDGGGVLRRSRDPPDRRMVVERPKPSRTGPRSKTPVYRPFFCFRSNATQI